jgi:hypothetical protein
MSIDAVKRNFKTVHHECIKCIHAGNRLKIAYLWLVAEEKVLAL